VAELAALVAVELAERPMGSFVTAPSWPLQAQHFRTAVAGLAAHRLEQSGLAVRPAILLTVSDLEPFNTLRISPSMPFWITTVICSISQ